MEYSLIASTNPEWLQGGVGTLTGIFDSVGLHTNVVKTFRILFCPFHAVGTQSKEAY